MRFVYVRFFIGNHACLSLFAAKKLKNNGLMLLLFETPSGSLVLHFSLILRFTFTYLLL